MRRSAAASVRKSRRPRTATRRRGTAHRRQSASNDTRKRARSARVASNGARLETLRPISWNELNDLLFADSWQDSLNRFRSNFAYRGACDRREKLTTSLADLGKHAASHEPHLFRNFRKLAGRDAVPGDSLWNWLALAQHHGLPTRLLDWSFSPYVALHFATDDPSEFDRDGAIWCVDYVRTHRLLPERLRAALARECANVFTAEMLDSVAPSLEDLESLAPEPFVLFLDPPSLDERIVNQYALFSIASAADVALEDWIADHPRLARRIELPASLKWEVRDRLDQVNITERVLFPGLDGLSRWLTRYYAARDDIPANMRSRLDKEREVGTVREAPAAGSKLPRR